VPRWRDAAAAEFRSAAVSRIGGTGSDRAITRGFLAYQYLDGLKLRHTSWGVEPYGLESSEARPDCSSQQPLFFSKNLKDRVTCDFSSSSSDSLALRLPKVRQRPAPSRHAEAAQQGQHLVAFAKIGSKTARCDGADPIPQYSIV
jgi:hypothetical protein